MHWPVGAHPTLGEATPGHSARERCTCSHYPTVHTVSELLGGGASLGMLHEASLPKERNTGSEEHAQPLSLVTQPSTQCSRAAQNSETKTREAELAGHVPRAPPKALRNTSSTGSQYWRGDPDPRFLPSIRELWVEYGAVDRRGCAAPHVELEFSVIKNATQEIRNAKWCVRACRLCL